MLGHHLTPKCRLRADARRRLSRCLAATGAMQGKTLAVPHNHAHGKAGGAQRSHVMPKLQPAEQLVGGQHPGEHTCSAESFPAL